MREKYSFDIKKTLYEFVSIQSDTGTKLEKNLEKYLLEFISQLSCFKEKKDFGTYRLNQDRLDREVVWALLKRDSDDTIILLNHHDVVDSYDYGEIKSFAYEPDTLRDKLKVFNLPQDVIRDISSGEWIFGRGSADMKAGIVIQLAVLDKLSRDKNFNGNILFLSVPDEEALSHGMRECTKLLLKLKTKYSLNYKLLINSEPHEREKEDEYIVYEGSVGKTMAVVYVRGKKSHIGQIFQGLNPSLIMSKIISNTEMNSELCDIRLGESSPPPSWSYCRDFKEVYDASIPEAAGGYLSFLTLERTPKDIISGLKKICEKSFTEAIKQANFNYKKFTNSNDELKWRVNVKQYSELYKAAKEYCGEKIDDILKETLDRIEGDIKEGKITIPESNFLIIKTLLNNVPYTEPIVVIAFSPPYYPHISNRDMKLSEDIEKLSEFIDTIARKDYKNVVKKREYFMGISDLSYAGLMDNDEVIPYIEPNMPLWNEKFYTIPFEAMKKLSIPIINIGPWGKDIHKMTERVYKPDIMSQTPWLIESVIRYLLKDKGDK